MLVREADPERDAEAVAAIYAEVGIATVASLEERAPTAAAMADRMRTVLARYPWLIADSGGAVAGYAYATEHRWRSAYRWAVDVTVYIASEHHRRGVGRALYAELLARLTAQGLHTALAGITLPNPASVGLHETFGFRRIGVYENIGYKHGGWRSVAWYQAQLRAPEPDGAAPAEPRPPAPPPAEPRPSTP